VTSILTVVVGVLIADYLRRPRQELPPEAKEDIAILQIAIAVFAAGWLIFEIWN
jgi:hypothetical protein